MRRRLSLPAIAELPVHSVIWVLIAITFYPFFFMFVTSLKDFDQFVHNFFGLPSPPVWVNYLVAYKRVIGSIANTVLVTLVTVAGVLLVASISAFTFARFLFPGRELLFLLILALLMIPGLLTLVPAFLVVRDLGLVDTRWGLILPYVANGQVFAIFILRSFFASIPDEIFQAARIDGANMVQQFVRIAVPLSKPSLLTVAIMNVLSTWNDFIWPLLVLARQSLWTINLRLNSFLSMVASQNLQGPMFAGYVLSSIPLILLFAVSVRYFVAGLTSGALKA